MESQYPTFYTPLFPPRQLPFTAQPTSLQPQQQQQQGGSNGMKGQDLNSLRIKSTLDNFKNSLVSIEGRFERFSEELFVLGSTLQLRVQEKKEGEKVEGKEEEEKRRKREIEEIEIRFKSSLDEGLKGVLEGFKEVVGELDTASTSALSTLINNTSNSLQQSLTSTSTTTSTLLKSTSKQLEKKLKTDLNQFLEELKVGIGKLGDKVLDSLSAQNEENKKRGEGLEGKLDFFLERFEKRLSKEKEERELKGKELEGIKETENRVLKLRLERIEDQLLNISTSNNKVQEQIFEEFRGIRGVLEVFIIDQQEEGRKREREKEEEEKEVLRLVEQDPKVRAQTVLEDQLRVQIPIPSLTPSNLRLNQPHLAEMNVEQINEEHSTPTKPQNQNQIHLVEVEKNGKFSSSSSYLDPSSTSSNSLNYPLVVPIKLTSYNKDENISIHSSSNLNSSIPKSRKSNSNSNSAINPNPNPRKRTLISSSTSPSSSPPYLNSQEDHSQSQVEVLESTQLEIAVDQAQPQTSSNSNSSTTTTTNFERILIDHPSNSNRNSRGSNQSINSNDSTNNNNERKKRRRIIEQDLSQPFTTSSSQFELDGTSDTEMNDGVEAVGKRIDKGKGREVLEEEEPETQDEDEDEED